MASSRLALSCPPLLCPIIARAWFDHLMGGHGWRQGDWLRRIAMITHRGQMHDDPVVFAMRDRISLICFAVVLVLAVAGLGSW